MEPEEVCAYIRLLCFQWSKGSIPKTSKRLERITAVPSDVVERVLSEHFVQSENGWRNERLEQVRIEQIEHREKMSQRGKAGAEARWNKQCLSKARAVPDTMLNHMPKNGTPSPSPSPSTVDIDSDQISMAEERLDAMRKAGFQANSNGDRRLAWQAAVLSVSLYSENWFLDSLEGVKATKPKNKWAYFTKCLRTKAAEMGHDFDADRKRVPSKRKRAVSGSKLPTVQIKKA